MTRLSYILATLAFVFGLLVPTSVLNAQDDVRERRCKFIEELLLSDSPQQLVDAARDFQWTCSQFAGALAVAEGPEVLIPGLQTFEAKRADLHNRLVPFKVPLIQGHVAACNSSLEQLRQVFGQGFSIAGAG